MNSPTIREVLLIGGTNAKEQISKLSMGVDIVVATPGRLEEFIQSGFFLTFSREQKFCTFYGLLALF